MTPTKRTIKISGRLLFGLLICISSIKWNSGTVIAATTALLEETFADASQFTTSTAFFSDGGGDFFGISDGAGGGDFGGGPAPSAMKAYTGFTGNFLTGMDLDGEGASLPITITWAGVDISGESDLQFSADFAEYFDDPGDIDIADYLRVEVQIDGGGYVNILEFRGDTVSYNGLFAVDTDNDGVGDGATMGDAAQNFTAAIAGTGSTLDLRISISIDSGDEDIGIDNVTISSGSEPDSPPTVSSTSPADSETGVQLASDISINFSENVTVTATWYDITCGDSGMHAATVSGGPQNYTLDPDVDFSVAETCDVTIYAAQVADQDGTIDNMASDYSFSFTTYTPACGNPATFIHEIQGNGMSSPEDGNIHTIEGVVVGDYQAPGGGFNGFYVQEEDVDADADPTTSEGIFVYDGTSPIIDVSVGEVVRVTGTVDEFYNLTEINNVSDVEICAGSGLASAALPSLPVANLDDWEWYEGMLVNFTQTLYVTEHYNLSRYGEISLSVNDRLSNPTQVITPGLDANTLQDLNDRSQILLDDAITSENPDPIIYPSPELSATNTLRGGDSVVDLTGVMNYAFGMYLIEPVGPITFTHSNPRPTAPDPVGGSLQVASFNVLNYFSTIDDSGAICGPNSDQGCRGADSASEFTRQRDKIISAIVKMDADIVGLMEIENHATDAAVDDLINGLNAVAGAGTYAKVDTGPIGTDAIKVALIYQPANTTPVGTFAILDDSYDLNYRDDYNRPALAQTFAAANGMKVTVIVNHLKSKGSDCDALGDPDMGDGQGNCNLTRTAAANVLLDWLATDPTASGSPNFLIIGDLNSYAMEDPIVALEAGGFTNLYRAFSGDDYSYVFDGQWGTLDYSMASAALMPDVTGATAWHINSDEPRVLDYTEEFKSTDQLTSMYAPDEFRASDHDPIIIGLDLKWRINLPLIFNGD